MDNNYLQIQEELARLRGEIERVKGMVSQNSLLSVQAFNRPAIFSDRLRVPIYNSAPSVGEVGDLIAISGELYICTSTSPVTFTLVGTQS